MVSRWRSAILITKLYSEGFCATCPEYSVKWLANTGSLLHGCGVDNMSTLMILSAAFAGLAACLSLRSITHGGGRSRWTMALMVLSFISQLLVLGLRGEQRGSCPLMDAGEILLFLAWSLTLFYLLVGSAYRVSLLGLFTAPVVGLMLVVAGIPGVMDIAPMRRTVVDYWGEMHSALSVLSYGALGLAAIAGVMFIILNRLLKSHDTTSGLFKNMPPVNTLVSSMVRLAVVGIAFLSVGIFSGLMMRANGGAHFVVAMIVWLSYIALIVIWKWRGMTPRRMSMSLVMLFLVSLAVFGLL